MQDGSEVPARLVNQCAALTDLIDWRRSSQHSRGNILVAIPLCANFLAVPGLVPEQVREATSSVCTAEEKALGFQETQLQGNRKVSD